MSTSRNSQPTAANKFATINGVSVPPLGRCIFIALIVAAVVACAPSRKIAIEPMPNAMASITLQKDIDLVRLSGVLATAQEVQMVNDQAAELFGAAMIINELQIDEMRAPADWLDQVMQTAEKMTAVEDFSLIAGSGQLIVGGSVGSQQEADRIAEAAASLAGMELAVSSSLAYPVAGSEGALAATELVQRLQTGEEQKELFEGVVLEQPAVGIQQADLAVIPAVARVQNSDNVSVAVPVLAPGTDSDGDGISDSVDECVSRPGYPVNERGCQLLDGYLEGVRFYGTTDQLTEVAMDSLDGIAGILQEHPAAKIAVLAYGRDAGPAANMRAQASQRAHAVIDYLVSRGIDHRRLDAFALRHQKGSSQQIMIKEVD